PESLRTLDEYRIQIIQNVRLKARSNVDRTVKELPDKMGPSSNSFNFTVPTEELARTIESSMREILNKYNSCTVADLHTIVDAVPSFQDQRRGWTILSALRTVKDGEEWVLMFPPIEVLQ